MGYSRDSFCRFKELYETGGEAAADLLNDRVLPFFEQHEIPLNRVLTDRGTEYRGDPERHEYERYLAVGNIDPLAPRPAIRKPMGSANGFPRRC